MVHTARGCAVPTRVVALSAVFAVAVTALLVLGSGRALANHVGCGDTITSDATLDSDLTNCPNNGVVIGADDVSLNLNGHSIDGDGAPAVGCDFESEFCDFGVLNVGHDGVTIKNGSVRQFAIGVFLVDGARHSRVLRISATRHVFFGLAISAAARSLVRRGSFSRNIAPDGDGIGVFGSDHIRIVRNSIRRNPGPGIHLAESAGNLIKNNAFARNSPSLLMERADRTRVEGNRVIRGGGIIVAPGDRNVLARNRVVGGFDSIAIDKGEGNRIIRNAVAHSHGAGIRLAIRQPSLGGKNNLIRQNRVRASREDGFLVNQKDHHSILLGNVAIGSADDGFDIVSHTATLTRNRAVRNGDRGIEAGAGVNDGGGNVARNNGDPLQCITILCTA
jgi:parallel beta-helix repeat protein